MSFTGDIQKVVKEGRILAEQGVGRLLFTMNSTGRAREPGALANISVQSITAKMSKSELFREFISEILSTAALEIFGGVEKTLAEYKEQISRSEEERKRLQRLLDVVTQPEIKLHRTGSIFILNRNVSFVNDLKAVYQSK